MIDIKWFYVSLAKFVKIITIHTLGEKKTLNKIQPWKSHLLNEKHVLSH